MEIYIDAINRKGSTYQATDFQFNYMIGDNQLRERSRSASTAGCELVRINKTGGYQVEVKIPWSVLGITAPTQSYKIGLDVMLIDNDGGNWQGKKAWFNTADNSWNNPSTFGVANFGGTLPLKLLKFEGKPVKQEAHLTWATADEDNFRGFELYRSTNGLRYTAVSGLIAGGQSIYSYSDPMPPGYKTFFYKLRMIDLDGTARWSPVVKLSLQNGAPVFNVMPNPASNSALVVWGETENVKNIQSYLQTNEAISIGQICAAQNLGRTHFEYRTAWLVPDRAMALEKIGDYLAQSAPIDAPLRQAPSTRKVAFLFTGQGSQYTKMGLDLYQTNPIFKKHLDECISIADQYLRRSLLSVIFEEENLINETEFTQPSLFALEYSLAQVLIESGILPDFVMGHSLGEYVGATIAGVMSLENGLRLVIERARLMQNLPANGEMAAVFTSSTIVQEIIKPYSEEVAIAAINGPNHTVISGRKERVRELTQKIEAKGFTVRFLTVSHAFHSPMMDEMLEPFRTFARGLSFQGAKIPMISNLTGRVLEPGFCPDGDYWVQHIRQPVNFQENILELLRMGCDTFLEIGPHSTLIGMGKRCLTQAPEIDPQMVEWIATLQKDSVDTNVLFFRRKSKDTRSPKIFIPG